eukprot:Filipodium_phascolosomae@DN632_c1_g1_i1.p1
MGIITSCIIVCATIAAYNAQRDGGDSSDSTEMNGSDIMVTRRRYIPPSMVIVPVPVGAAGLPNPNPGPNTPLAARNRFHHNQNSHSPTTPTTTPMTTPTTTPMVVTIQHRRSPPVYSSLPIHQPTPLRTV